MYSGATSTRSYQLFYEKLIHTMNGVSMKSKSKSESTVRDIRRRTRRKRKSRFTWWYMQVLYQKLGLKFKIYIARLADWVGRKY